MKHSMAVRRTIVLGAVVTMMVFTRPAKTHAATELGDMCWQLSPFVDTLRLNVTQADLTDAGLFQSLHGRWRASGFYQIPASGHMSDSDAVPGSLAFGIAGSVSLSSGSNDSIALYANLDPVTLSGPFSLVVASTSPVGRNSGTMIPIACDATMGPATVGSGTALGR
jgi:hypothetical protein